MNNCEIKDDEIYTTWMPTNQITSSFLRNRTFNQETNTNSLTRINS